VIACRSVMRTSIGAIRSLLCEPRHQHRMCLPFRASPANSPSLWIGRCKSRNQVDRPCLFSPRYLHACSCPQNISQKIAQKNFPNHRHRKSTFFCEECKNPPADRADTHIRINRQWTQGDGRPCGFKKQSHKALISRRSTPAQFTRRTRFQTHRLSITKPIRTACKASLTSWTWPPKTSTLFFQTLY
jgi:hypothetical protein